MLPSPPVWQYNPPDQSHSKIIMSTHDSRPSQVQIPQLQVFWGGGVEHELRPVPSAFAAHT